jgi:hypothetical protein
MTPPDLPSELNKLKEEDAPVAYDPPYESEQGDLYVENEQTSPEGEEYDYTISQEGRDAEVPPIPEDNSPMGGVDRRGESGDQGDDELNNFRTEP